jgi:hypothetical protein
VHIDIYLALGSAVVGFLVGMTGLGGGALMTPMLVLVFGIAPSAAISSDLIAALFMKPFGVAIHWKRKTVESRIVKLLCIGSVPAALAGTYVMHLMGNSATAEKQLEILLGAALILGSAAMIVRAFVPSQHVQSDKLARLRKYPTIAVGAVCGFMVGLTSVGAGSLVMIFLIMLYPTLRNERLVGTDMAQSIPLTMAATVGSLLFGHVEFAVTASIVVGSVPAVIVGSLISSKGSFRVVKPFIAGVVLLSGLKYVGTPIPALGVAAVVIMAAGIFITLRTKPIEKPIELEPHFAVANANE